MEYPTETIERFGGVTQFVAAVNQRADAPDRLEPGAVYMWKSRNSVPWKWRAFVGALAASATEAAESSGSEGDATARSASEGSAGGLAGIAPGDAPSGLEGDAA